MIYNYFVSYYYDNDDANGFGCLTVSSDKMINDENGLNEMISYIKTENNLKTVVILNFKLLNENKVIEQLQEQVDKLDKLKEFLDNQSSDKVSDNFVVVRLLDIKKIIE